MTYQHQDRRSRRLTATVTDLEVVRQRALLVGVTGFDQVVNTSSDLSLQELELLTDTAGSDPVETVLLRRSQLHPATLIGSGQLEELVDTSTALDIDVVIFDNELSPAQQRNLSQSFSCDVVDRTALILDIFAQHASSKAGTLQVELAMLQYTLPRLRGKGVQLSRLGGGINTRGPGETALEMDRREIENRIASLKKQLEGVAATRRTQRKSRQRSGKPLVALVGYTNAGKSTLLNRLTQSQMLAEDRLFSTLDSTVRRMDLTEGPSVLVSDTVGFVRRLPHQLVQAFASTLEEVLQADLILQLVDGSDPDLEGQIKAVQEVLSEIEAHEIPRHLVLTKQDLLEHTQLLHAQNRYPEMVAISAATGEGIAELERVILGRLQEQEQSVLIQLDIPYQQAELTAAAHRLGQVVEETHHDQGSSLSVWLSPQQVSRFSAYQVG